MNPLEATAAAPGCHSGAGAAYPTSRAEPMAPAAWLDGADSSPKFPLLTRGNAVEKFPGSVLDPEKSSPENPRVEGSRGHFPVEPSSSQITRPVLQNHDFGFPGKTSIKRTFSPEVSVISVVRENRDDSDRSRTHDYGSPRSPRSRNRTPLHRFQFGFVPSRIAPLREF